MPASASTGVAELLRGPVRPARVLMSVPAAVYLQVPNERGGDVVGVLTSDAARLPLGCVLFRPSNGRPLVALPSGAPAEVGGGRIVVGDLAVSAAAWWNPRPKLPSLRPALLPEGVRQLRNALYGEGVPHSAFTLPGLPTGPGGPLAALRGAVRRADLDAALRTATRLIGLGPGLTPAGDDVMAGTIAGLVLLGPPGGGAVRRRRSTRWPPAARPSSPGRCCGTPPAAGSAASTPPCCTAWSASGRSRPAVAGLLATGSTSGRAMALGLCTAIDLVDRTTRDALTGTIRAPPPAGKGRSASVSGPLSDGGQQRAQAVPLARSGSRRPRDSSRSTGSPSQRPVTCAVCGPPYCSVQATSAGQRRERVVHALQVGAGRLRRRGGCRRRCRAQVSVQRCGADAVAAVELDDAGRSSAGEMPRRRRRRPVAAAPPPASDGRRSQQGEHGSAERRGARRQRRTRELATGRGTGPFRCGRRGCW